MSNSSSEWIIEGKDHEGKPETTKVVIEPHEDIFQVTARVVSRPNLVYPEFSTHNIMYEFETEENAREMALGLVRDIRTTYRAREEHREWRRARRISLALVDVADCADGTEAQAIYALSVLLRRGRSKQALASLQERP